jgi:putative nucleotidyltransferase with HDIG domain
VEPDQNTAWQDPLKAILARIGEISTIQQTATRVASIASDPSSGAAELASAIEIDPALSARIIRIVNSAAYGLRRRVSQLGEAITLLGFKRVRNLAMAAMVCELFKSGHQIGPYDRQGLWRHLMGVGIGARAMARFSGHADPEEAFLAGLLHDIGIIIEDQYAHEQFVQALLAATIEEPFCATEKRILGFDHTQLGCQIAVDWRFPRSTIDAITFHHRPDDCSGPTRLLVYAVAVANWVCTESGIPSMGLRNIAPPSREMIDLLGLTEEDLGRFSDAIESKLATDDLLLIV